MSGTLMKPHISYPLVLYTQVYLDYIPCTPSKKKIRRKRGGGYLINQSNRLHIMQWVLSNLDFIKRGKREHT